MSDRYKLNLGICRLRMWMAFEVVLLHRMSWKGYEGAFFGFLKACEMFSVPVFMIVSFYFSAYIFERNDNDLFLNRLKRLLIPQVGWAIICWIVYYLTDIIFMHKVDHTLIDLFWAIVSGCRYNTNPSTWFQAVLILLTIYFFLLFKLFKKNKGWVMVYVSLVIALAIQDNGRYFAFFSNTPYELANTVGRIFEIMPYACVGLIFNHLKIDKYGKKKRTTAIIVAVFLFVLGFYLPFPAHEGGFFDGIYPLYMGTALFVIFLLLPINDVTYNVRNIILEVTRFTLGVYCAHRLVYGILDIVYELLSLEPAAMTKCVMTYLACYVMSYIMSLLPLKAFDRMVE